MAQGSKKSPFQDSEAAAGIAKICRFPLFRPSFREELDVCTPL
jgi:hypothetical protein